MKTLETILALALLLSPAMQAQVQVPVNRENTATKTNEESQVRSVDVRAGKAGLAHAAFFSGAEALSAEASPASSDAGLRLVYEAIAAARARIRSSQKCQTFFHNQGLQKIDETLYSMQDLGPGPFAAQVEGNRVVLNRNPQGSFMRPPADYNGLTDSVQIRGFYILHELAHELSRYTHFARDHSVRASDNRTRHVRNDELLHKSCY